MPKSDGLVRASVLALVLLVPQPREAAAAWPADPNLNLPLCTAPGPQKYPEIVSDGAGGAIVAWQDRRSGTDDDIYAQHVLASGAVDPAWPAGGVALCTATGDQFEPTLVGDGAGGAIVAWSDYRGGPASQNYMQHVLASGVVDPAWLPDGRPVAATATIQSGPVLAADGAGGAIALWSDYDDSHVYAQHVPADGGVDFAWPMTGLRLGSATGAQESASAIADGAGGVLVAWQEIRGGDPDLYAQHVLSSGMADPVWPADGRPLCTAASGQWLVFARVFAMVSDDAGGAIVTWEDWRSGTDPDIYAQRVLASGELDPAWPVDGRAVCTATDTQDGARLVGDGAGGAIVSWRDLRNGVDVDLYAHHVLANGTLDPVWPAQGRAVCDAAGDQLSRAIVTDGAGGAIIVARDQRKGDIDDDIFAYHVLANGQPDPLWPFNGRALCTAADVQAWPMMVPDGSGGAIVCWDDARGGGGADIYAQRVKGDGQLGGVVVGVPAGPALTLELGPVCPNPSRDGTWSVSCSLAAGGRPSLELFDLAGRRVLARDLSALGGGRRTIVLGGGAASPPGIYLLRLTQDGHQRTRRLVRLP